MLDDLAGISPATFELLPEPQRTEYKEGTYQILKAWTGQDFGLDVDAWRAWMQERPDWFMEPEFDERIEQLVARKAQEREELAKHLPISYGGLNKIP